MEASKRRNSTVRVKTHNKKKRKGTTMKVFEKQLQFSYVVQAQYEHQTAAEAMRTYNTGFNMAKTGDA